MNWGGTLKRKPCSLLFGNEINCLRHISHYFSDRSRKKEKWNCTSRLLVSHITPKPVTHSTFHGMIEILNFLYFSNSQIATVSTGERLKDLFVIYAAPSKLTFCLSYVSNLYSLCRVSRLTSLNSLLCLCGFCTCDWHDI